MAGIAGQPSPKPTNLPATPATKDAFDTYYDSGGGTGMHAAPAAAPTAAPSDAFDAAVAKTQAAAPQGTDPMSAGDVAMSALDYGARGLDYAGGAVRTGLAAAAGAVTGNSDVVTGQDVADAAKGKAPNSAEYLRRLGVSEGGSLQLPLIGKVTVRGAEGLALDIATDPLTMISKTMKELPYLKTLLNAPGAASEAVGAAIYKSALPAKAQEAGKAIIEGIPAGAYGSATVGVKGAPIAGTAGLAQKVEDMSRTMGGIRQGLYDKATSLGAAVDLTQTPVKHTDMILARLRRDPNLEPLAVELETMLANYRNKGAVPIGQVSEWKTNLTDALPASAWNGLGQLKNISQQFKAALALDLRNAIVETGNKAEKGLGETIDKLNDKWGTLLDAGKALDKAAQGSSGGGKLGNMIDAMALAFGHVQGLAVKKSYDIATTPYMKTVAGNALMLAGKHGLASRAVIDAARAQRPELQPPEGQ